MKEDKFDYDIITIGMGPAGMAVSAMGHAMGLKTLAIEKNKIGGECMNVGCIPSKALLRVAKKFNHAKLYAEKSPKAPTPFEKIAEHIQYIGDKKTSKMLGNVKVILGKGGAEFVDDHTVKVDHRRITAKRIFIATGTSPMIPPIEGIKDVEYLTNENMFLLKEVPKSMVIIGGGAIGTEMAQAFSRLGTKISIVHMDKHLIPIGDEEAGKLIEAEFEKEGIDVYSGRSIVKVYKKDDEICVKTKEGEVLRGEKLLVAAGRKIDLSALKLENAGVETTERGALKVNKYLQTNVKHIYGVGDCNGHILLSHAAMHQGMIALMNSFSLIKQNFKKFPVPWTVFTEPQVSYVGMSEKELKEKKIKYQTIRTEYADYGAAIAEEIPTGFVKVFASSMGKIYGVSIVGEGSGEMINEWALAMHTKTRLHKMMMLAHSFPTMGFMTKRIAEIWMMGKMKNPILKKIISWLY
jgi:pyruvate/2-oxoglutarate dehydrogenase complex dihydrolipoamide dehydrogenase (E3) component